MPLQCFDYDCKWRPRWNVRKGMTEERRNMAQKKLTNKYEIVTNNRQHLRTGISSRSWACLLPFALPFLFSVRAFITVQYRIVKILIKCNDMKWTNTDAWDFAVNDCNARAHTRTKREWTRKRHIWRLREREKEKECPREAEKQQKNELTSI